MKISDVVGSLVAVWTEWQQANFLINPRYVRQGNIITWQGHSAGMTEEPITQSHVLDFIDRGQYTFQINIDESIVQLHYVFNRNDEISAANLAYYALDVNSEGQAGWIRIDFDPSSYRGALHPKCHMHISLFPNMRFVVDGVPSPKQFVDFIALACYPDVYESLHTDENGNFRDRNRMKSVNAPSLHLDEPELYKYLTHIRIPLETA